MFSPGGEMVLPADRRVKFEVTATDVLHAFWVPAFRMKIDAVPGGVTTTYATPNVTGGRDDDIGFRLVCAELCGTGHSVMAMPVRVVEPDEFEAWVAEKALAR
jgi:cytochrome c oxidase subunit 2